MSTPMMLLMVLIRLTASAPPRFAASPCGTMSDTLGVSLTITGTVENSAAQEVIRSLTAGSWPTALPMPRSHMPWGQPKFSSRPSAPASSLRAMNSFHSSLVSTIKDAMMACLGKRRLVSAISR